jgi:hypothetical protein
MELLMKQKPAYEELEQRVVDLEFELDSLKHIVPICASCKKVRDDDHFWNKILKYIQDHSNKALMSYNLCPDCADELSDVLSEI